MEVKGDKKKLKVFIWLVFRDQINSKNLFRRKRCLVSNNDYTCNLCDHNCEETTYHLLFNCLFSISCWNYIGVQWDHSLDFFNMIMVAKDLFRKFFMEILAILAWEIWKLRNNAIFRNSCPTFFLGRLISMKH